MQSGQVIYLVISLIVILMGCASLAIDVGFLWGARERMQTAADAAAVAASDALLGGGSGNITTAGRASTAQNGFTNGLGTTGNTNLVGITVNQPPASGAFTSNAQAVEVIVQQTQPSMFMSVMGVSSVAVAARAVALPTGSDGCIFVLNPTVSGAMRATSSGSITAGNCGMLVDSSSSTAITGSSGATISASGIGVVGNATSSSGSSISPAPVTGIAAFPDPLSALPTPSVGTCVSAPAVTGSSVVMNPGYYCGLTINPAGQITLNPGLYSLNGNVSIDKSGTLLGSGVTLYFKTGALQTTSGSTVTVSAPTSGTYEGVLIFEDRSNTAGLNINSGGSATMTGALYLPDATITVSKGGFGNLYSILVADQVSVTSGGGLTVNSDYSGLVDGSPIRRSVVVE
jgi:hypothetical protein